MVLPGIVQYIDIRNYRMTSVIPYYGRTKTVQLSLSVPDKKLRLLFLQARNNAIKSSSLRSIYNGNIVNLLCSLYNYGRRIVLQAHKIGPYLPFGTL
jgi:hypothetical protein